MAGWWHTSLFKGVIYVYLCVFLCFVSINFKSVSMWITTHLMNWSNSISMKWSWKQKRWSQDHECANLIKILLVLQLILWVVKNLLLLLWPLGAECDPLYSIFSLSATLNMNSPQRCLAERTQRPTTAGSLGQMSKINNLDVTTDVTMVLLPVFLPTSNLPSPFHQKAFPCPLLLLHKPPRPFFHPALPFTWRSYSSFSKAHQAQCFSPV